MIRRSFSNDRSRKMNSANFQHQPMAGMYWITFLAYALQLPSTRLFSQKIQPNSQSISYVWFISSSEFCCRLPLRSTSGSQ